jgi:hypothetical protein
MSLLHSLTCVTVRHRVVVAERDRSARPVQRRPMRSAAVVTPRHPTQPPRSRASPPAVVQFLAGPLPLQNVQL